MPVVEIARGLPSDLTAVIGVQVEELAPYVRSTSAILKDSTSPVTSASDDLKNLRTEDARPGALLDAHGIDARPPLIKGIDTTPLRDKVRFIESRSVKPPSRPFLPMHNV